MYMYEKKRRDSSGGKGSAFPGGTGTISLEASIRV
jgi:hypothetical protein